MGLAYYSDRFNEGTPIEESWINRHNSEDFSGLVSYEERYQPKAGRYNMGEYSNFIHTPMLIKSIQQLLEWTPTAIEQYCENISTSSIEQLQAKGCFIESPSHRTKHLFGVYLPKNIALEKLKNAFSATNVFVSFRGNAIRISPNVYNTEEDFERLLACFNQL
jgi:selenocysteine lyase/cysteine desulfurase